MTQRHSIRLIPGQWPAKSSAFQPFGTDPQTTSIPVEDFQSVPSGIGEQEQMPGPDFQTEFVSDQSVQSIISLAHVGGSKTDIDPGRRSKPKQRSHLLTGSDQAR